MNVLITGANRGIGLALASLYKARGDDVIAAVRRSSKELDGLGVRVETGVDVTDEHSLAKLARDLGETPIDLLLLNAGVLVPDDLGDVRIMDVQRQLEVNAVGPLRAVKALDGHLREGAKVAILSSRMGSMGDNTSGGYYGYRMSKAAVNAFGVSLAIDLKPRGVAVVLLHPGFVRTAMTGGNGQIEAPEAAAGIVARIDETSLENTGRFVHMNGDPLVW